MCELVFKCFFLWDRIAGSTTQDVSKGMAPVHISFGVILLTVDRWGKNMWLEWGCLLGWVCVLQHTG